MSDKMFTDQIAECLAELSPHAQEDLQIASDGIIKVIKQECNKTFFSPNQALELLVKVHNRYRRDPDGGWCER